MNERPARLKLLDQVYDDLKTHSSLYLAALLVTEAYQAECLRNMAFNTGTSDDAAIKVAQRLGKPMAPLDVTVVKAKRGQSRRERVARQLADVGLPRLLMNLEVEAP